MKEPTLKEMTESFVLVYDYEQLAAENERLSAQLERLIEENNNLRSHRDQLMDELAATKAPLPPNAVGNGRRESAPDAEDGGCSPSR